MEKCFETAQFQPCVSLFSVDILNTLGHSSYIRSVVSLVSNSLTASKTMFTIRIPLRKSLYGFVAHGRAVRSMSSVSQVSTEDIEVKPFDAIPGPKGIYQWPIVGEILTFKPFTNFTPETISDYFKQMYETYGPIVKLRLGSPLVLIADPKDFETVFRNEGKYPFRDNLNIFEIYFKRNNIKGTISILQGPEWQNMRSAANKVLMRHDSALHYLQQQNEVADDFVRILQTQKVSQEYLQDLFSRYASESIGVVAFNKRLGLFDDNPDKDSIDFLKAAETSLNMVSRAVLGKSIAHRWYRNSTYRQLESAMNLARRVAIDHITQARKTLENDIKLGTFDQDQPNLLFSLLSEKRLNDGYVASVMISLYLAGTDSTAKNAQVFLYNIAKHPEKQKILRNEIMDIIGPDGPLTAQDLSKMVYLKASLKESFRTAFPLPSGTTRILPVDVVVGGYKVPAGVKIMMYNHAATRTHFENPDQFLPERWLRSEENTKKDRAHSLIVSPFGHGPRNCLGRQFALQEIYLIAVKVLQRLEVSAQVEAEKFIYKPFIESEKPIHFKFTKIS